MKASYTLNAVKTMFLAIIISSIPATLFAQKTTSSQQQTVVETWIEHQNLNNFKIKNSFTISDDKYALATVYNLQPEGFVITTQDKTLRPIIAYSYKGSYEPGDNPLQILITKDIGNRLKDKNTERITGNIAEWDAWLSGEKNLETVQYWPEPGTTTTGGWVEEEWSQRAPYNDLCPLDLVNGGRSVAGCPSIALGLIIDFHKELHNTQFTDADDYHHTYGGNNYYIDDDFINYDFPDFPALNVMLEGISLKYSTGDILTNNEKAALVFACGVAAYQVYGAGGSGTFGVDQAFDAYQRFGFEEAKLVFETDTSFFTQMKQNIMDGLPVHLAVLVANGPGGHNVVADGYCTDDYYHVNFGWGGQYNSWYDVPEGFPYNLTIIEGAVMDIGKVNVGIDNQSISEDEVKVYPNPYRDYARLSLFTKKAGTLEVTIHNLTGQVVYSETQKIIAPGNCELQIGELLKNGIYMVRICVNDQVITKKLIHEKY